MIGGASVGDRDHARAAFASPGMTTVFAGIAMKPGKPVWYGRFGDLHDIGLAGNPAAAMTAARRLLAPLLSALSGRPPGTALRWMQVPSATMLPAVGTHELFLCAAHDGVAVRAFSEQHAFGQKRLAESQPLVRRRALAPAIEARTALTGLEF